MPSRVARSILWNELLSVLKRLRQQLARFFAPSGASKTGLSDSTLQRLEVGDQNITIDNLEELMIRLKCRFRDISRD